MIAVKQATSVIPIVFAAASDPVGTGLVASLARPGGNVTGLSLQFTDLAGKRLELLREVLPDLRRLAILANASSPATALEVAEVQAMARTFGLEVAAPEVRQTEDIAPAFEALKGRVEALYVVNDPLVGTNRVRINTLALAARLPTLHGDREFDPSLSLAANFAVTHNKAAYDVVGCDPRPEAHMKRREFITLLGGAAATWPRAAGAQQPAKSYRVAYLALLAGQDATIVKQRLTELGYSVGKNLVFDLRSAEGQSDRLPQVAADLVKTNPDVIVAGFGTATAKAMQAATATIPVVFTAVGDPIGTGIVKSLSRPGGNLTGMHAQATDIFGKRLQILEDMAPGIRVIAVLLNQDQPFTPVALPELRIAADARGQRLELCDVHTVEQLTTSVAAAAKAGATALTVLETPVLLGLRREIVDLAAKLRLFAIYGNREFVTAGGLLSYGTDRRQLYRRAAELVDKILKGEKPADIPVERPTKFELVINLKTAKALGLSVPDKLLALADEVIE